MQDTEGSSGTSLANFTSGQVERKVFLETIQHPATLFPAVIALTSLLYMGIVSFDPLSFTVLLASGALSMGVWIFNYFIRGEKLGAEYVQRYREEREQSKRREAELLSQECARYGFAEGQKEASELEGAYQTLRAYLAQKVKTQQNVSAERFLMLAQDTNEQGIAALRAALETYQALCAINIKELERERNDARKKTKDASNPMLTAKIESNTKVIELYYERKQRLDELLAECERLEGALKSAYLQVTSSEGDTLDTILTKSSAVSELENAVSAARLVEKKLRALGGNGATEDQEYLAAGLNSAKTQQGGTIDGK